MPTLISRPLPRSRALAWVPVALIHLALFALWRGSVQAPPRAVADGPAMQWVWIKPPLKAAPPIAATAIAPPLRPPGNPPARAPRAGAPTMPPTMAPRPAPVRPAEPAAPGSSAAEPAITIVDSDPFARPERDTSDAANAARIRAQARRELGKIDRDLRRASPSQIHAPVSTPQTRLIAGLNDAKVVHWNEAAQVEEIADPTGSGKRIAKIKTFMGTYCTTHDSNRSAVDGFSPNTKGPKLTNCPK